jgi:DNA-binding PucR family transcriptional regulator
MAGIWESALAADIEQNRARYIDAVNAEVRTSVPELFADPERTRFAAASTAGLLDAFADHLRLGLDSGFHAPPAAIAYARHLARADVPLASLLRAYRIGQAALFQRAVQLVIQGDEPSPDTAITQLAVLMFRLNDEAMVDVAQEFERRHEGTMRDILARRDSVVRALITGAPIDIQVAERTLDYRLDGLHVACIGWTGRDAAPATLEEAIRELLGMIGARRSLMLAHSDAEILAWAQVEAAPTARQLTGARAVLEAVGARAAIGSARPGVRGFVRSNRQAELARAVASLRDEPSLADYQHLGLPALLLSDLAAAREFATEELGALAGANGPSRELRATLASYLGTGQDQTATAKALGVHRNTIMRRLQQIEQQLPHPLSERWPEAAAALTIREWTDPDAAGPPAHG